MDWIQLAKNMVLQLNFPNLLINFSCMEGIT
jgi:hypothetical protein